ncbi:hypothetical protein EBR96_07985 [bacterium]|nr:hypothetical protein [bacterium]
MGTVLNGVFCFLLIFGMGFFGGVGVVMAGELKVSDMVDHYREKGTQEYWAGFFITSDRLREIDNFTLKKLGVNYKITDFPNAKFRPDTVFRDPVYFNDEDLAAGRGAGRRSSSRPSARESGTTFQEWSESNSKGRVLNPDDRDVKASSQTSKKPTTLEDLSVRKF